MSPLNTGSSGVRRTSRNSRGPKSFRLHAIGEVSISGQPGLARTASGLCGRPFTGGNVICPARSRYIQKLNLVENAGGMGWSPRHALACRGNPRPLYIKEALVGACIGITLSASTCAPRDGAKARHAGRGKLQKTGG